MTNYKLVPVEPTQEMLVAINWPNDPTGYRAMLAAAPQTEQTMEFSKGKTYEAGNCGIYLSGIDQVGENPWGHRIEVYGTTPANAEDLRDRVLLALTVPQPAEQQAAPDVAGLEFTLAHPDGEKHTVMLTKDEVQQYMVEEIYDKLGALVCSCEPVGETNVCDCNCIDRIEQFKIAAHQKREGE